MPSRKRTRLRRRVRAVNRQVARIEERLDALKDVDGPELRGLLKSWVERTLAADNGLLDDADTDNDGTVDFEELVEAVRDEVDDLVEAGPLLEFITDVGLNVAADVAVAIYRRTEARLDRRLARRKRVLARLENKLAAASQ